MMVLVDTSVWVSHFKRCVAALVALLESDRVLSHPMVLLELTCGTPPEPKSRTLATLAEAMAFVGQERLYGAGCGLVDVVLLASALLTPQARLWTLDKRLAGLCERFAVEYRSK
ncbi:type II toxin-antitoxin system VapC family toxin [Cupriavidus agavae]|uniref:Uncharacterized protein n=1 Tax=Cupriavidus agavae TaxID=1001822 RepID=A0A4Q7RT42_9BURK|nr:VapC toxin family PIN domain ribonuclease [Cupriavidus agavae]RZT35522.1 hypothetical protein EV147_3978 [Cupriavidus agavae]